MLSTAMSIVTSLRGLNLCSVISLNNEEFSRITLCSKHLSVFIPLCLGLKLIFFVTKDIYTVLHRICSVSKKLSYLFDLLPEFFLERKSKSVKSFHGV